MKTGAGAFYLAACAMMGLLVQFPAPVKCAEDSCGKSFGDQGTTFDLSPLKLPGGYYKVRNQDVGFENYTYVFNVCGNTAEIPGSGPTGRGDKCLNTTIWQGDTDFMWNPAPAYQIARHDDLCWRMAEDYSNSNIEWSLLEPEDPSRGVVMKYKGGNLCNHESDSQRRYLEIAFPCADDIMNIPDKEVIEEVKDCQYELIVPSIYGCPTECGVKDRQLCNNKGICRYDRTEKASRCFCSKGWEGDACGAETAKSKKSGNGPLTILIIVCVFLTCVIAGISVVWLKIRGLRLDPQAYATLSGGSQQQQEEL